MDTHKQITFQFDLCWGKLTPLVNQLNSDFHSILADTLIGSSFFQSDKFVTSIQLQIKDEIKLHNEI